MADIEEISEHIFGEIFIKYEKNKKKSKNYWNF